MASKELRSNISAVVGLNTQLINTDTTTNGVKIDTKGFESVTFVSTAGVVTAGDVTPLIEDSADNITFAAVVDDFLVGTEVAGLLDATNETSSIGYIGKKRYVRASLVSDNSANLTVGVTCILEAAHNLPATS